MLLLLIGLSLIVYLIYHRRLRIKESECIVVVTGCDSGLGEKIAIALSRIGFLVIASCLTDDGMKRLNGVVALTVKCDVTNEDEVNQLCNKVKEYIREKTSKSAVPEEVFLWAVINNAGIANSGAVDWLSMDTVRKVMAVNYIGTASVCKAFIPMLKETKYSRIINISSSAGYLSFVYGGAYCASKFAVQGYSQCLRFELSPFSVKVCTINPGFLNTPLLSSNEKAAFKEFELASKDRTADYSTRGMKKFQSLVMQSKEDPTIVVNCVIDLMYQRQPHFINNPGYGGFSARLMAALPPMIEEWIQSIFIWWFDLHPLSNMNIVYKNFKKSGKKVVDDNNLFIKKGR